ncbi:MAG: hypothetical protein Q9159_005251 [Coniocarpon cinnabarinum]
MSRRSTVPNGSSKEDNTAADKGQEKQARLLATDVGHFSMIRSAAPQNRSGQTQGLTFSRALHLADVVTVGNEQGFCGYMSILSSLRYCLGNPSHFTNLWLALAFMPFGLFFDFFDGKVARWRGKASLMGQELDSLADLISFGASPAAAAFAIGMRTPVDQICLTYFVICALLRLARFNVTVSQLPKDKTGKSKYFEGTPAPTSLSIAALMAYWVSQGSILDKLPLGLVASGSPFEFHAAVGLFVVHGCLMCSKTLKVPKP